MICPYVPYVECPTRGLGCETCMVLLEFLEDCEGEEGGGVNGVEIS